MTHCAPNHHFHTCALLSLSVPRRMCGRPTSHLQRPRLVSGGPSAPVVARYSHRFFPSQILASPKSRKHCVYLQKKPRLNQPVTVCYSTLMLLDPELPVYVSTVCTFGYVKKKKRRVNQSSVFCKRECPHSADLTNTFMTPTENVSSSSAAHLAGTKPLASLCYHVFILSF